MEARVSRLPAALGGPLPPDSGRYELSIEIALDPEADLVFAVVPEVSEDALVDRVSQIARALGDGVGKREERVPGGAGLLRLRVGPLPARIRLTSPHDQVVALLVRRHPDEIGLGLRGPDGVVMSPLLAHELPVDLTAGAHGAASAGR